MTDITVTPAVAETEVMSRNAASLQSILFVEDDSNDFIIARYRLEQIKVRNPIIYVPTAAEMVAFLDGHDGYSDRRKYPLPAVVIMDMRLPDRSGIAAQSIIRSSLKHRKTPIISISGDNRLALLQQAVELGANAWMTKPFEPADFLAIVTRLNLPVLFENLDPHFRS
ncbi:MAG: response regulator [Limisphaerales bacterium]